MAFNINIHSWLFIVSLIVLTLICLGISYTELRSRHVRNWLEGETSTVIEDGRILDENLARQKMTRDLLFQELREQEVFDVAEVRQARIERDGKVSVELKKAYKPVTYGDLEKLLGRAAAAPPPEAAGGLSDSKPTGGNAERASLSPTKGVALELVVDGRPLGDNLERLGLSRNWLQAELEGRRLRLEEVRYAVRSVSGELFVFANQEVNPD